MLTAETHNKGGFCPPVFVRDQGRYMIPKACVGSQKTQSPSPSPYLSWRVHPRVNIETTISTSEGAVSIAEGVEVVEYVQELMLQSPKLLLSASLVL